MSEQGWSLGRRSRPNSSYESMPGGHSSGSRGSSVVLGDTFRCGVLPRQLVGGRTERSWWFVYLALSSLLVEQFEAFVSCEFTYGYEAEDYIVAVINLTYMDPLTALPRNENGEMGKFGVGKTEDVTGVVFHVTSNNHTSHDACDRLDVDNLPREPFIALIQYGNCRDSTKLRHAAASNASAAVVYSNNPDSRSIKMYPKVQRIVSVFISKEKGEEIAALVDNGTRVMMHITVGARSNFRYGNINRTSVLFVSISFIVLMIISLAWLVFYYIQRFRYIHAKEMLAKRLCSAAKKALDKIPVKTIKSNELEHENDDDYECCAVCIEFFRQGEIIRTLPCKHSFHKNCVDPWLLEHRSCPMCKLDILMYFGLVFSGSQESVLDIDDDDYRRHRHGHLEEEVIHVPAHSQVSSSPATPLRRDRGTSPCSLSSLELNATEVEHSFITAVSMSDVAVNTSDPPSEVDYESSEERWTSPFPRKFIEKSVPRSHSQESLNPKSSNTRSQTFSSPETDA